MLFPRNKIIEGKKIGYFWLDLFDFPFSQLTKRWNLSCLNFFLWLFENTNWPFFSLFLIHFSNNWLSYSSLFHPLCGILFFFYHSSYRMCLYFFCFIFQNQITLIFFRIIWIFIFPIIFYIFVYVWLLSGIYFYYYV